MTISGIGCTKHRSVLQQLGQRHRVPFMGNFEDQSPGHFFAKKNPVFQAFSLHRGQNVFGEGYILLCAIVLYY